jgi:hypothetical protein
MKITTITLSLGILIATSLVCSADQSNHTPQKKPMSNKVCQQENYREFDFWIGHWEVKNKQGKVIGFNQIEPILGGCGLAENWQSANGFKGKSYNFYDNKTKLWHQTWIDSSGGILYLNGNLQRKSMLLSGNRPAQSPSGESKSIIHKISWTPLNDGRVRQYWQSSNDSGETWQVLFEGFYSKK